VILPATSPGAPAAGVSAEAAAVGAAALAWAIFERNGSVIHWNFCNLYRKNQFTLSRPQ